MNRYRHDIISKTNHKLEKRIMNRYRYNIDSQFYLIRSELILEPNMNWYRHESVAINNIDTKRNNWWEKWSWIDIDTISTKKSFLLNLSSSEKGTDHGAIPKRYHRYRRYRHKKEITNEEADIDRKCHSCHSCHVVVGEQIMNGYRYNIVSCMSILSVSYLHVVLDISRGFVLIWTVLAMCPKLR
jgi:hypothetical protein